MRFYRLVIQERMRCCQFFGHNVDEISKTVHIQGFGGRGGSKGASESISLTIKIRIPLNCGLILDCVISKGSRRGAKEERYGFSAADSIIGQIYAAMVVNF